MACWRLLSTALSLTLFPAANMAQDKKFEFTAFVGITANSKIEIDPRSVPEGQAAAKAGPKGAFSWGLSFDCLAAANFSVGFQWSHQAGRLIGELQNGSTREFTDLDVFNYHGILSYSFFKGDARARPFFFVGVGATHYRPGSFGGNRVDGDTRFSSTWGGGVKLYAGPKVGFRLMARWTPTYVQTGETGIWCSPDWGCPPAGSANYQHAGEFSAGIILRF